MPFKIVGPAALEPGQYFQNVPQLGMGKEWTCAIEDFSTSQTVAGYLWSPWERLCTSRLQEVLSYRKIETKTRLTLNALHGSFRDRLQCVEFGVRKHSLDICRLAHHLRISSHLWFNPGLQSVIRIVLKLIYIRWGAIWDVICFFLCSSKFPSNPSRLLRACYV
jgi:hypothetical protein